MTFLFRICRLIRWSTYIRLLKPALLPPDRRYSREFVHNTAWDMRSGSRHDRNNFGVSWNGEVGDGGVVVGKDVLITTDAEALLED